MFGSLAQRIGRAIGLPASGSGKPQPGAAYMRGDTGPLFRGWQPALREPSREVASAWTGAAARTIDLIHNSGFIAGGIDQAVADTIGNGLRLNARPDAEAFGLTSGQANDLGRQIESKFGIYCETPLDIDAESRKTFGHLQASAFRNWLALGEIVATLPEFVRPGGMWAAKCRIMPATRLSSKSDTSARIIHGVKLDKFGGAVAYCFRNTDPTVQFAPVTEIEIPARDSFGRPIVVHSFDGMPGHVRGISPLAPALQVAKQFDQLANATLTAEILRAVFVATMESDVPTVDSLQALQTQAEQARAGADGSLMDAWFDSREGWYDKTNIDLGIAGRFVHLFPGQKMTFHEASGNASNYKEYAKLLLHEIARCMGQTVESVSVDWNGTTYTGARVATAQIHAVTAYRRKNIVTPFCQAVYDAWLDEAVRDGRIEWPGGYDAFLANRPAACRAIWRGAPKPVVDDLKTAKAHEIWARLGVMTDEMIANDLGIDIEDAYEQRARERQMQAEYGLPERTFAGAAASSDQEKSTEEEDGDGQ